MAADGPARPSRRAAGLGLAAAGLAAAAPLAACADIAEAALWRRYKSGFLRPDGRIVDTGNGGVSHTEGQGFSMLLAQAHGDRTAFERMWRWTRAHLRRAEDGLFSWRYDPAAQPPAADPNNATDGDIFIAWALTRAAQAWSRPAYAQEAAALRGQIARSLVVEIGGRRLLSPGLSGFREEGRLIYNASYFVAPAIQDFHRAAPAEGWDRVLADGLAEADSARFGALGLPVDWSRRDAQGVSAPAPGRPPRFGFDAVRAPLYLVWSGHDDHPQVAAARALWAPLLARGEAPPAWIDVTSGEQADYAMSSGARALAATVCGQAAPSLAFEDYYSAALGLLAALARREAASRRG